MPLAEEEYLNWLLAVAASTEPESTRQVLRAVERIRSRLDDREIAEALRSRNAARLAAALREAGTVEAIGASAHAVASRLLEAIGPRAAERLADLLGRSADEVQWEQLATRARLWLRRHGAELVAPEGLLGAPTRQAIRDTITRLFDEPLAAQRAVPVLRGIVGLNGPQARALDNYWRRDLLPALDAGDISEARARQLAERYRQRLLKHRAIMIARSETMMAGNAAQRELWREADGQLFERGTYLRESRAILYDGRVCRFCYERHGWRAPVGGVYQDGSDGPPWPHGGIASTGCRCQEALVRPESSQPGKPPFVEPEGGGTLRPAV